MPRFVIPAHLLASAGVWRGGLEQMKVLESSGGSRSIFGFYALPFNGT
jgi:hypothetical protein